MINPNLLETAFVKVLKDVQAAIAFDEIKDAYEYCYIMDTMISELLKGCEEADKPQLLKWKIEFTNIMEYLN